MSSRYLVDPELTGLLDAFPPLGLANTPLDSVRAAIGAMSPPPQLGDGDGLRVEALSVPGLNGDPPVGILLYRPTDRRSRCPALLHIHGGGHVMGSASGSDPANRALARALGCVVASVDYRLAPEAPYPAAVHDCLAALAWLHDQADALGIDAARIGVKGESAGGGLAAALALLARDRGGPAPAFQHLIFPMLDDRTCTTTDPHPLTGEFIWTASDNLFGWTALLGRAPGGADVSPYAAPARATELAGLPPTFLSVGALDLFLEEDLAFATRLARAGVPVELHVYPGAFHAFQLAPGAEVTRAAERDSRSALRRAFAR